MSGSHKPKKYSHYYSFNFCFESDILEPSVWLTVEEFKKQIRVRDDWDLKESIEHVDTAPRWFIELSLKDKRRNFTKGSLIKKKGKQAQ